MQRWYDRVGREALTGSGDRIGRIDGSRIEARGADDSGIG
jgi:hypothetical protein